MHKGIDALMAGAPLERAAARRTRVRRQHGRLRNGLRARVEDALGIEAPPRAVCLRALAAELERLANHLGDIGAVHDAAFGSIMHAACGLLREQVLRTAFANWATA